MTRSGAGDRWMRGEAVDGVAFAHHARVQLVAGRHDGTAGIVMLLMAIDPEPAYLVTLDGGGDVRARQSELAPAD